MVSTKKEREKYCEEDYIYLKLYQQIPIGWIEERLTIDNKLGILREFGINDILMSDKELNKKFIKFLEKNKNNEDLQRLIEIKLSENKWESYVLDSIYKLSSKEYIKPNLKNLFDELETIHNCKEYVNNFFHYNFFNKAELEANNDRLETIAEKYNIIIKNFDIKQDIEILYDIFLENYDLIEKELKDLIFKNIKYTNNLDWDNKIYLENTNLREKNEKLEKENKKLKKENKELNMKIIKICIIGE